MNTKTGAAAAIGIPRDSYVSIPGVGSERINAALYYGGPELLGETVGNLIGIMPDYVFVTRFEKFANMVNDIGGIEVDNPTYFSDTYLKPQGFEAGKLHLNGYLALAFSRIRKTLLRGDFDRSANQQRVLRGIQAKIRDRASVHGFIEKGVLSAMQNMATNASPAELYRLARAAAAVKPSLITNCVVLGGIGNVGGASVVLPYPTWPSGSATGPARTRRSSPATDVIVPACRAAARVADRHPPSRIALRAPAARRLRRP